MYRMYEALYLLYWMTGFASLVVSCLFVRRNWEGMYKLLAGLSVAAFLIEILATFWSEATHHSNHFIYNLYLPVNCCGFLYFFYRASVHSRLRLINGWLMAAVLPGAFIAYTVRPGLFFINTYACIFYYFLLLLSCIGAYIDLLLEKRHLRLLGEPLFWLAGGMFLNCVGSIIYYTFWAYGEKMILFTLFMTLAYTTSIFLYLGMIGCFICVRRANAVQDQNPGSVPANGLLT